MERNDEDLEKKINEIVELKMEGISIELRTDALRKACEFMDEVVRDSKKTNMVLFICGILWGFIGLTVLSLELIKHCK